MYRKKALTMTLFFGKIKMKEHVCGNVFERKEKDMNQKDYYQAPDAMLIRFMSADIVTASRNDPDEGEWDSQ